MTNEDRARVLMRKVGELIAPLSEAELVTVLEGVLEMEAQGVPADVVGLYGRVVIEAVEQRIDGVEDAVNAWFEAIPWDQGTSQEEYARVVAKVARERLAG